MIYRNRVTLKKLQSKVLVGFSYKHFEGGIQQKANDFSNVKYMQTCWARGSGHNFVGFFFSRNVDKNNEESK